MKLELPDNTWRPPKKANMIICPICGEHAYAWMKVTEGEHYYHEATDDCKEAYGGPVIRTSICEVKHSGETGKEEEEAKSEGTQI